ncbi:hypothetical protein GYH30_021799 [Glycine max]|nr:hypothetical protein GYH30_021799 [Glycine max]
MQCDREEGYSRKVKVVFAAPWFCNVTREEVSSILTLTHISAHQQRAALFHSIPPLQRKRRNHWDSRGSNHTSRRFRRVQAKHRDWIVQYDPPDEPNEYIHRVGRIARGEGGKGNALLFLIPEELQFLRYLKVGFQRIPIYWAVLAIYFYKQHL